MGDLLWQLWEGDVMRWLIVGLLGLALVFGYLEHVEAESVQWRIEDGGNGHWYETIVADQPVEVGGPLFVDGVWVTGYTGGITWTEARDAATVEGGWLVDVTSAAENAFVYDLVEPTLHPEFWFQELGDIHQNGLGPWLGGFQPAGSPEPGGNWQWITGSQFTDASGNPTQYTNWYTGYPQPQNTYQIVGSGPPEDALHFYALSPDWNDYPSWTVTSGYVVEYVPEPSSFVVLFLGAVILLFARRK